MFLFCANSYKVFLNAASYFVLFYLSVSTGESGSETAYSSAPCCYEKDLQATERTGLVQAGCCLI